MKMTEAEAKKKWCPFARAVEAYSRVPVNRKVSVYTDQPSGSASGCECIASGCGVWEWAEPPRRAWSRNPHQGWEYVSAEDSGDGFDMWVEPEADYLARRTGYCGLSRRQA
jgi:hypothetical protein